ncbi:hypothetical protein ACEPPN_008394 [Leptodophora sp. 'Broadleaf-Isolate-01']
MEPACANNTALEAQEATGIIAAFNEFKLFPKLPLELRLLIFAAAVAGVEPRNIEIFKSENRPVIRNGWPSSFCLASSASIPGLLHTCREARDVAKKTYKLAFAGRPVRGPIYFDWDKDSLVLLHEFNFETFFALSENPNPGLPKYRISQDAQEVFVKLQNLIINKIPSQWFSSIVAWRYYKRLHSV